MKILKIALIYKAVTMILLYALVAANDCVESYWDCVLGATILEAGLLFNIFVDEPLSKKSKIYRDFQKNLKKQ